MPLLPPATTTHSSARAPEVIPMPRAAAKAASFPRRAMGTSHSGLVDFLDPGSRIAQNASRGDPLTARSVLDPAGVVLHAPPAPPPPAPVFPDVAGAELSARRNVRRRALAS